MFASNRGSLITFDVWAINAYGSAPVRLTNDHALDAEPSWSPDGDRIVFTSNRDSLLNPEIYVMNADGASPARLTTNPAADLSPRW